MRPMGAFPFCEFWSSDLAAEEVNTFQAAMRRLSAIVGLDDDVPRLDSVVQDGRRLASLAALFGPRSNVTGKLVATVPATAHPRIENLAELRGNVALITRGGCSFFEKATNAQALGAIGIVFTNDNKDDPEEEIQCSADG